MPKTITKAKFESFIKVTPANRKFAVKEGRKFYVCAKVDRTIKVLGEFDYRPRLKKGFHNWYNLKFKVEKEETREEYAESFRPIIDLLIKEEKLFFNPEELLLKYD